MSQGPCSLRRRGADSLPVSSSGFEGSKPGGAGGAGGGRKRCNRAMIGRITAITSVIALVLVLTAFKPPSLTTRVTMDSGAAPHRASAPGTQARGFGGGVGVGGGALKSRNHGLANPAMPGNGPEMTAADTLSSGPVSAAAPAPAAPVGAPLMGDAGVFGGPGGGAAEDAPFAAEAEAIGVASADTKAHSEWDTLLVGLRSKLEQAMQATYAMKAASGARLRKEGDMTREEQAVARLDNELQHQYPFVSVRRWESPLAVFQAVNRSMEYFILRNWENLPASFVRGDHHDVDIYVKSRATFAKEVGCELTGPKSVQCWLLCNNGQSFKFDVHGPDDKVEYYPVQWGLEMLKSRIVSSPPPEISHGHGGVFRATDLHYYYSLLYHLARHGKTYVKEDYVPVLEGLKSRLGAKLPDDLRDLTKIRDAVDKFLNCQDNFVAPEHCVQ